MGSKHGAVGGSGDGSRVVVVVWRFNHSMV